MNANRVARAVVHWVGFESACHRENLLSERSLSHPVGQCLKVMSNNKVEPEYPHPHPQLVRRKIDMVIEDIAAPGRLVDAVEMKFVRQSGRDYAQELFNDLIRLERIPPQAGKGPVGRWLLIAGVWQDIEQKVLGYARPNIGGGVPVPVFQGILPTNLLAGNTANRITVDVQGSGGLVRSFWEESQRWLQLQSLPTAFRIDFRAKFPRNPTASSYACLLWRILRSNPQAEFTLIPPVGGAPNVP